MGVADTAAAGPAAGTPAAGLLALKLPAELQALTGSDEEDIRIITWGVQHLLRQLCWGPEESVLVLHALLLKRALQEVRPGRARC